MKELYMTDTSKEAPYFGAYHSGAEQFVQGHGLGANGRTIAPPGTADTVDLSKRMPKYRDNSIVIFYERSVKDIDKSTGEQKTVDTIYFRSQEPGNPPLQVVDRPATPDDKLKYPKQWEAFRDNKDRAAKALGTSLTQLFQQQPSLVKDLQARGIPTVEHLANLNEFGIEAIKDIGGVGRVKEAQTYLEKLPDRTIAAQTTEIEALKAKITELEGQLAARPQRQRVRL